MYGARVMNNYFMKYKKMKKKLFPKLNYVIIVVQNV